MNPKGGVQYLGGGKYIIGDTVTLTAVPSANENDDIIEFQSWKVNGEVVGTDTIYSFTAQEDVEVTAVFEVDTTPPIMVDYIQSSGTQYIDTKVTGTNNTRVEMEIEILETSPNNSFVFGARTSQTVNTYAIARVNGYFRTDYGTQNTTTSVKDLGLVLIDANKNVVTINGTETTHTEQTFTTPSSLALFTLNQSGTFKANGVHARLFSCQIYENDILVRDFKPCKTVNGVGGLWDEVKSKFYGNKGSGTFIAGPEISEITS